MKIPAILWQPDYPYYEHTIHFEAEVPYENKGWSNGQDLSKFDKEELEEVVKKKNLQIKKLYETKDLEKLVQLEHINGLKYGIANYRKRRISKEYLIVSSATH